MLSSPCLWQDFATIDTNHNSVLEMSEIRRLLAMQLDRMPSEEELVSFFASADTDQDGVMSLNEYIAAVLNDPEFTVEVLAPLSWCCVCVLSALN